MAESFFCIVEIPKGSRNKYEFDHEHNVIRLDRFLFSSVVYPTDYGFIPETLSLDGDPLDVMVLVSEPTFPGCMIEVKPIGLFRMEDDQGIDDKVLCVPLTDPGWNTLESLDGVSDQLQNEIAHFFTVYKQLENKKVEVDGWYPCEDALKVIAASRGGDGRWLPVRRHRSPSRRTGLCRVVRDATRRRRPVGTVAQECGQPSGAPIVTSANARQTPVGSERRALPQRRPGLSGRPPLPGALLYRAPSPSGRPASWLGAGAPPWCASGRRVTR